ncbi:hypothetical protein ACRAWD_10525 [Caulobacter segnis]
MLCWGVQAYFMKLANARMSAESIFFYMMVSGLLVAPSGAGHDRLLPADQLGAGRLRAWPPPSRCSTPSAAPTLVYACRHGKAIVVAPLTNAGGIPW